jgi:hypothetical protein
MEIFDLEKTIAAMQLEQMLVSYNRTTDFDNGATGPEFFVEDCVINVGAILFKGHDGVRKYFSDRAEAMKKEKDGVRTARHTYANLQITFPEKDRATLKYLILTYAASGKPPIMDNMTPAVIADATINARRVNGQWKFVELTGSPVFIASTGPAQKAMLGKS